MSDRLLILAALLFGLATVLYPFGGDQGLYYYVGREWLSGSVPYRDVMEQKTPLVFMLHAFLISVTGQNMWAIRVAELAFVPLVGWAVASLATPRGATRRPGVLGVASLATSMMYFGIFNYWDTAQCEIWYAGLSLLAAAVATRRAAGRSTWLLGGLLAGLALLMKPPAAFLLGVAAAAMALRVWSEAPPESRVRAAATALATFGAGALAPIALVALYFAAHGALDELVDLAFHANYHDMVHSATVSSARDVWHKFQEFSDKSGPWALASIGLALAGSALALARRSRDLARRYGLALALLAAGAAAVTMQRKFYGYHWGVLAPLMALPLACVADDLARLDARLPRVWRGETLPSILATLLALVFLATDLAQAQPYTATVARTVRYASGRIDRAEFLAPFVLRDNTPYAHQEAAGRWIATHSAPHDLVAVRGFEQTVYAVARRRAPTRFFWTRWLTDPHCAYRRDEWLAQDQQALERHPPRYVVVTNRAADGPASRAWFEARGYAERVRHGRLIVLERTTPAPARLR